ncbi:hypothetical protein PSYPI_28214 [Pseudomonas syringae pv. pisi str. 1704B]|uniref:Uncharacterized protein n=1 Tax=Pseudomonas syringae pv. pisi str. 1704B TaxID=629263 RepID=F3GFZ6_PSESJ|nr:hypothetical protein PSYPI_28214 [Pseudomonas syringae pv. pisi str. 1704B]RMM22394.1 hypothetical protein ALQ82_200187 [Pseudomonas syringae pv. pisi]
MKHNDILEPLTPRAFDAMTMEFDRARDWMLEQIRLKRSATEPAIDADKETELS